MAEGERVKWESVGRKGWMKERTGRERMRGAQGGQRHLTSAGE